MTLPKPMVSSADGSNPFSTGSRRSLLIQGSAITKTIAGPDSSTVSMYLWLSESVSVSPKDLPKAREEMTSRVKY